MIPETSVNWKAFEYKYSDNPQRAFENLTYYLFCHEFHQKNGIFRYFNQPHIETNPISAGGKQIGFQSKYYSESIAISSKESEMMEAVTGAAGRYPGITTLYFYIGHEFSLSSKKNTVKPAYQIRIENTARAHGIEIEWRGISNIEAQLMQDGELTVCRNIFFQVDSAVQRCCENLEKHKKDIFSHINTSVNYKENRIVLKQNKLNLDSFLNSDHQVFIVDGDAGSGKSALIKQETGNLGDEIAFLAFKSTDLDVDDKLKFLSFYGTLILDEILEVYKEAKRRILYIDAAEKYFILENQQTFEEILQVFIAAGWKLIFTIRTAYKESFRDLLPNNIKADQYHVSPIRYDNLLELSNTYGFWLPKDPKLVSLLCAPFYLGLYLALEHLDEEEMSVLNREAFEEKIWEDIIRVNKRRKDNMQVRREAAFTHITMEMLQSESYFYIIQAGDDHEALSELEQSGLLIQTDNARKYSHSHDVFEELAANHIFMEQYKNGTSGEKFFERFRTSLRIRKLFRGWLSDFAGIKDHQKLIFEILDGKNVDRIWKDEVLLTVISTENLKDVYDKITLNMADDNVMLKKIIFLINTCCRVADYTQTYLNKGNLFPFRISKPSGYAWKALFDFIFDHRDFIRWDRELISVVIDVLNSWTKHLENAKMDNTKIAGKIGLFLFQKMAEDKDFKYSVKEEQISRLQDVLLHSAWRIGEELREIFQVVIDEKKREIRKGEFFVSIGGGQEIPQMYIDLAESAVWDIYHFGYVPNVMPEITIELMKKLWIKPDGASVYHNTDMDEYFGINPYQSNNYYPASAYKTPIVNLLQRDQKLATDFLIDFVNMAGNAYANSYLATGNIHTDLYLNTERKECFKIEIYVEDDKIEQIASDRLWKMHRGTHVGPELLVSLLMGFETWLFTVVRNSKTDVIIDYCRYILIQSQNVMLTSVIVSVAEAYPEKMLDLICDFIRTKEIFHLDTSRQISEPTHSFLYSGDMFQKERQESNRLPHRKKRLEDVILGCQTDPNGISEERFNSRLQKLYRAIDTAATKIDTWKLVDRYAYYRMDLRRYQETGEAWTDEKGNMLHTIKPDFPEEMKEHSRQNQVENSSRWKFMDLELWSYYKFNGNKEFQKYKKYSDVMAVCKELKELWEFLSGLDKEERKKEQDIELLACRYISIISYTSAVLLRDFNEDLTEKELCEDIIFNFGEMFARASDYNIRQAGNGMEAVTLGLILVINEENRKFADDRNPLYLLLKLVLRDWRHDSTIIKQIANSIWKYNEENGWRFLCIFSLIADSCEKEIWKKEFSLDDFLKQHKKAVAQVLEKDSMSIADIDFTGLSSVTLFTIISLVAAEKKEAFTIAEITKDTAMKMVFSNQYYMKKERRHLTGYRLNYVVWFADVLLHCNEKERKILIDFFLERADIPGSDNIEHLLICLIQDQEIYRKTEEFWSVWELLKPRFIELGAERESYYYSSSNVPGRKDRIIISYLFANSAWTENLHQCALLSRERAAFFDDFIDRSENLKAMFYAFSELLNTVGKESYKECGMEWIYKLVIKDPECKVKFLYNTLFYLEEYVGNFVLRHRADFRTDVKLTQKAQTVLEYMVNQGSQIAFFVREQI